MQEDTLNYCQLGYVISVLLFGFCCFYSQAGEQGRVIATFQIANFVVPDFDSLRDIERFFQWLANWMDRGLAPYDDDVRVVGTFELVVALRMIHIDRNFHARKELISRFTKSFNANVPTCKWKCP